MTAIIYQCLLLVGLVTLIICDSTNYESPEDDYSDYEFMPNSTETLSPAAELMWAAKMAGYNLTLEAFDAAELVDDDLLQDLMPLPVAEKYRDYRSRDQLATIREQMIGLIFTGHPLPLGSPHRSRWRPKTSNMPNKNRRISHGNTRFNPQDRYRTSFNPKGEANINFQKKVANPDEILKPFPFVPNKSQIQYPMNKGKLAPTRRNRPNSFPNHQNNRPNNHQGSRPSSSHQGNRPSTTQQNIRLKPPHGIRPSSSNTFRTQNRPRPNNFPDFGNTLGPDFGPVTFEEFGGNFGSDLNGNTNSKPTPTKAPQKPPRRPHRPVSDIRRPVRPTNNFPTRKPAGNPGSSFSGNAGSSLSGSGGSCQKYTEDICLDVANYPHEAILTSLSRDRSRADTMIADEIDQSADELVDGLTSTMEERYDYTHYFGNRRQDSNHAHRDFAEDGGYLCPSEVKYARPKRARNSKGEWKFVVNMDKYTQTIRMEKCLKPGGSCSYVSHHYHATCKQIYNYQRLLSWEDKRGLHMDIYKVPSCCSCHIQGYAYVFPPLSNNKIRRQSTAGSNPTETKVSPGVTRMGPPYEGVSRSDKEDIQGRKAIQETNLSKVNYHYHPIIDYFENK